VLAQQVFFAQLDLDPGPRQSFSMEAWDGYAAARDRLLAAIATPGVANPVVLTGDVHRNWACEVKSNFADPESATIATEFVGTSISSGRDGADLPADSAQLLAANPHLRFTNGQRGYLRCELDRTGWRTDFRVLAYVTRPGAPVSSRTAGPAPSQAEPGSGGCEHHRLRGGRAQPPELVQCPTLATAATPQFAPPCVPACARACRSRLRAPCSRCPSACWLMAPGSARPPRS